MANADMIRPYVEQQVAAILGIEQLKKDDDGDIPVVSGSCVTFISVVDGPTGPMVRFVAPLLHEVKKSPELLERLNQMNTTSPYVRFFWVDEEVLCAMDIAGEDVQRDEIGNALGAVSWHADNFDDALQKDFGGKRMIEPDEANKAADLDTLQRGSIFGQEAKPLPYLLCQMNLLLHGLDAPQIDPGNALRFKLSEIGEKDRVDVILTNPPFGGEEEAGGGVGHGGGS